MDAELIWRSKSDDEVVAAGRRLSDYEADGQRIIQAELERRGLTAESPVDETPISAAPNGIRGWLILPAMGLALSCIFGIANLAYALYLTTDAFAAGYGGAVIRALFVEAGMLGFTIFATVRFMARRRNAPRIVIALLATRVAVEGILLIAAQSQGQQLQGGGAGIGFVRAAVAAGIWITYFSVSKRVKATFVN